MLYFEVIANDPSVLQSPVNRRASQRVDYSSYLHEDEDEEGIRYADNEMPHEPRKEVNFTPNYL